MKAKSVFAAILELGSRATLVLVVVCFGVYLSGALPSSVSVGDIDRYWGLSLANYAEATGIPTGAGAWLFRLASGDGLAALPVILLSFLSLAAYIAIALPTIRERDWLYVLFIVLEAALLGAAAIGWL